MARLFFSYSHDDEAYRDRLDKHLAMLKNQGLIEARHDRRIAATHRVVMQRRWPPVMPAA